MKVKYIETGKTFVSRERRIKGHHDNLVARWRATQERDGLMHLSGASREDRKGSAEDVEKYRRAGWDEKANN